MFEFLQMNLYLFYKQKTKNISKFPLIISYYSFLRPFLSQSFNNMSLWLGGGGQGFVADKIAC